MFTKTKHHIRRFICAMAVATAIIPIQSSATDMFESGFSRITIDDPMGGFMKLSVWYPTHEAASPFNLGPFNLLVAKNAEIANGIFGLVVLSHGTGGSDLGHRDIAEKLAQNGFIAVAPLHPRNNFQDNSGLGHRIVWEGRPRQLSAVIDYFLQTTTWKQHIDTRRIGAFGFSFGGYTVLSLIGAQHNPLVLARHCEQHAIDPLCQNFGDLTTHMREIYRNEYADPPNDVTDPRIKAAVLADPMTGAFSDNALSAILDIPLSVYLPQIENELLASLHGTRLVRLLTHTDRLHEPVSVTIPNAHHFSFISPFPDSIAQSYPRIAGDQANFDRADFHQKLAKDITRFFKESFR